MNKLGVRYSDYNRIFLGVLEVVKDKRGKWCYYIPIRSALITKRFLNSRVYVAGDIRGVSFIVRRYMLGKSFGSFSVTKKLGTIIHESKKKKGVKSGTMKKKKKK